MTQKRVLTTTNKPEKEKQIGEFHKSGLTAFKCNNFDLAIKNFEECDKLKPSVNSKAWILFSCIFSGNREKAFDMFGVLFDKGPEDLRKTLRYYLLLMDEIFDSIPPEFKYVLEETKTVGNITFSINELRERQKNSKKSQEEKDNEIKITEMKNKIRHDALYNKYGYAASLVDELKELRDKPTISDDIEKTLLQYAADKAAKRREDYITYLKNEDFASFEQLLSDRISNHIYSSVEEYLFKLYNHLKDFKKGIIPETKDTPSNDIFEAIDNNDFFTAIRYDRKYSKEKGHIVFEHPLYIMLNKVIIEMIRSSMRSGVAGVDTMNLIDKYLEAIEKPGYKNIIKQLIVVGIQKGNFDDVFDALNSIYLGEYHLNTNSLISRFEIATYERNIIGARAYMNILSSFDSFNQSDNAERFKGVLASIEQVELEKVEFANIYGELALDRGAKIFDVSNVQNINALLAEAESHKDVATTVVNGKMIVRYKAEEWPKGILASLEGKSNDAYIRRQYDECIENGLLFVEHSKSVEPSIYSYLGEAYYAKEQYDLALNYFNIYLSHNNTSQEARAKVERYAKFLDGYIKDQQGKSQEGVGKTGASQRKVKNKS